MKDEKECAYGYMRVFSDEAGREAYEVERSLRRYAEANHLHLGGIYHEFVSGSLDGFNEMVDVLRCTGAGSVILPSLRHLSENRALRKALLDRLEFSFSIEVHSLAEHHGQAGDRLRAWDRLTLVALPTAVGCARAFTKVMLRWWRASRILDEALLVTSELVTNAVQATEAERVIGVQLQIIDDSVLVEVWDDSPALPVLKDPDADAEIGRGLCLVDELAKRWGTSEAPAGGKIVWAELTLSQQSEPFTGPAPLPHRVPGNLRVPEGPAKEKVETALMRRVLEGLGNL
ncbi:ATP-binding protein [Streptomyces sp. 029-5]|uniref:ATP-binding protein n=1 Tax=Streptomyces sp. 029-5 TaxID=2789261 RepID=UPI003980AEDF